MPNTQSSELGFESHFAVCAFLFSPRHSSSLSSINEYLVIDSGGNVRVNSLMGMKSKCFERSERSEGLDTTLYKNIPLPFLLWLLRKCFIRGQWSM